MCQISRLLLWKWPQECLNVAIEFCFIMRIFYELRYTVIIEIVWTFYLKNVPAKFQKYSKHISWVISRTSSSKLSCNPRHPSRNIICNHRHHLLQPSSRRIFSTSNNQKTRVDSDINSDYKASSFDKLYIRRRKWDTAGFVRAHQRKKCAHRRPRPCWRWLQLQPSCGSPQWHCHHHSCHVLAKQHQQQWERHISFFTEYTSPSTKRSNLLALILWPLWDLDAILKM